MKVLFTGHRGFLGREIIPEINKSFQLSFYQHDLTDYTQLSRFIADQKIERIIHAAVRGGRRNRIDSHLDLVENLVASVNVLKLQLPTISFCSGKIYGWQNAIENKSEIDTGDIFPKDLYGQFKYIFRSLVINEDQIKLIRFFNVFGVSESNERFMKANIARYARKETMLIHQDFIMDFFYVKDSVPIISDWLNGLEIPKETNLVYSQKMKLSEICSLINELDTHKVEIHIEDKNPGKNYYGNGQNFSKLGYKSEGLEAGIRIMYERQMKELNSASLID
jgi:nucleoside-diphosphate-sugar epimerase